MKKLIEYSIVLCFSIIFTVLHAADLVKPLDNKPIEITSDRLEAYDEKKLIIFMGNAVATQGDRTIKAQSIYLYYQKDEKRASRDVKRIEAKGDVSITQGDRVVTGDQAVYDHEAQRITVLGNAIMRQGMNVVRGDKIEVYLVENRGVVESKENKRVKAIIYPEEGSKRVKE